MEAAQLLSVGVASRVYVRGYYRTRNGVEHYVRAHTRRPPMRKRKKNLVH
jgi:hypothetical protein